MASEIGSGIDLAGSEVITALLWIMPESSHLFLSGSAFVRGRPGWSSPVCCDKDPLASDLAVHSTEELAWLSRNKLV